MLEHLGLSPRTRAEQREIAALLEASDENGSGELDFDEFASMIQHVHEQLNALLHKEVLQVAKGLSMSMAQIQEYRAAFEILDTKETGQIDLGSIQQMVDSLHISISG